MKPYPCTLARAFVSIFMLFILGQTVSATPIELSLVDCIAFALENNPAMKIAENDQEKYRWAVKQAQAGNNMSLSLSHTDNRYNNYFYYNKFDNQISLTLPVYSGGKLENQIDQAKINLTIAEFNREATKQQLKLSATTAYFDVLHYRNIVQVNKESVEDLSLHLKNVQTQFAAGMVARSNVLYSQVQLATAKDSLIRAQNNYDNAVANLNNVIGLPLDSELILKENLQYEKNVLEMEECVQQALMNRPEIAQYQAKIDIAQDDVNIAQSGNLPTVSFQGTQDWNGQDLPGSKNSNWRISLTTSLNLFDSGLTQSEIKQAQYATDTAKKQLRQAQDSVALEVRQAYHNMRDAESRIETNEIAVKQAEEDYRIAEYGFAAGVSTNMDVIDAELALSQAKTNYIQALYDYNTSKAQLDKARSVAVR